MAAFSSIAAGRSLYSDGIRNEPGRPFLDGRARELHRTRSGVAQHLNVGSLQKIVDVSARICSEFTRFAPRAEHQRATTRPDRFQKTGIRSKMALDDGSSTQRLR